MIFFKTLNRCYNFFFFSVKIHIMFDVWSYSAFGHSVFGIFGPFFFRRLVIWRLVIRRSVIRHLVIRPFVIRPFVIRPFVFRPSVIRPLVIRRPVFRPYVGESTWWPADEAEADRGNPRSCWRVEEAQNSSMEMAAILDKLGKMLKVLK
jgi:hypothetical protein